MTMSNEDLSGDQGAYRIRLPGFITEEEVGLGDLIKRATSSVGIKPCGGCSARADKLNTWVIIAGRQQK